MGRERRARTSFNMDRPSEGEEEADDDDENGAKLEGDGEETEETDLD